MNTDQQRRQDLEGQRQRAEHVREQAEERCQAEEEDRLVQEELRRVTEALRRQGEAERQRMADRLDQVAQVQAGLRAEIRLVRERLAQMEQWFNSLGQRLTALEDEAQRR